MCNVDKIIFKENKIFFVLPGQIKLFSHKLSFGYSLNCNCHYSNIVPFQKIKIFMNVKQYCLKFCCDSKI